MQPRATLHPATAAICLALVVLAAGCGGSGKGPRSGPSSPLLPSSPTALPQISPAAFQELITQLRGKPVVVNFWASWCGPCRQEAGELASVSKSHDGEVQFLGVDVKDTVTAARDFIERYGWSYPSVFDEAGAIQDSLGLIGLPQTVRGCLSERGDPHNLTHGVLIAAAVSTGPAGLLRELRLPRAGSRPRCPCSLPPGLRRTREALPLLATRGLPRRPRSSCPPVTASRHR